MQNRVIAEVSVIPVGTGEPGISRYIADCLAILGDKKNLCYRLTPMGTILEGTLDEVLEMICQMHEAPFRRGVFRVVTTIKIDDRRDKPATMDGKVESVLKLRPTIKT